MNVYSMWVTPKLARMYLEKNKINRNIRKSHVAYLVQQMQNGNFTVNGDSIRFDDYGNLVDGQHRLLACIESGVSFETVIIEGLNQNSVKDIDSNLVIRSATDQTGIDRITCSLIRGYSAYIDSFKGKLSASEYIEKYNEKKFLYDWAKSKKPHEKTIGLVPVWIGFILFAERDFRAAEMIANDYRVDCSIIQHSNVLKSWLYRNRTGGYSGQIEVLERTLYCLDAYYNKKTVTKVLRLKAANFLQQKTTTEQIRKISE